MNEMTQRPSIDAPQLRTLLLTDLCDSTTLVERIGDVAAATLFRDHDRLVLDLQQRWRGRLIDRSDGLLLLFERPIDGLGFALDYVRGLREMGASRRLDLKVRAGLHVGEVLTWRNSEEAVQVGAKPLEVEGLAKPMAARLMAMARPGQILLSAVAEPLAHRAARELGERGQHLLWKSHGRWRFKGMPDSQQIYEVGEPGIAPLRAPTNSPKAWRDVPLWRRPAALAAEAAVIVGIGVGVWFATRPAPAIAFNQRDWVVVADLRNLTGQTVLDDSMEQAFRISLEQSRYVNVLSDMKARDTLARMQLKSDTVLDRSVASEIALRDGARAVILPTVAEVGGKVRVSAEIIDPNTQATVYAETADGAGVNSVLASIDEVTGELRASLGETVKAIESDSAELPKVTTSSLEALRAYSLATKAYARRDFGEASQYFSEAIRLDPNFALAYMGLARIHISRAENEAAKPFLQKALDRKSRLTRRDGLYLDAWAAEFGDKAAVEAPLRWKTLAGMYPDFYAGHFQYAWSAFVNNRFDEALKYASIATAPQEPMRGTAMELVGRIELAREERLKALRSLQQAQAIGGYPANRRQAAALAALERFPQARQVLQTLPANGSPDGQLTNQLERIAIEVDQGRWKDAHTVAASSSNAAKRATPLMANEFRAIELMVQSMLDPARLREADLEQLAQNALTEAERSSNRDSTPQAFFALAALKLDQRAGRTALADRLIPRIRTLANRVGEPVLRQMVVVVEAGQQRLKGQPQDAIATLRPLIDGSELFQVHVALHDAYRAAGQNEKALAELNWIAEHRGRAYSEVAGDQVFQSLNVADTRLARLSRAEILWQGGKTADARQELDLFLAGWPLDQLPDHLRRRAAVMLLDSKAKTTV
ncbi:putative peptide modification system cyclase [Lysobacter panacisoli]|nr:putative peptide modification system cyclase [Lysobacter panacisoli]